MASGADGLGCAPEANAAKAAGNAAFQAGRYDEALKHYNEALLIDPNSALLRSNRAGALSSLSRHAEALVDAEACIAQKPDWWKGYSRRGHAQLNLGRLAESDQSFLKAYELNPSDSKLAERCSSIRASTSKTFAKEETSCAPTATVLSNFVRPTEEDVQRRLARGVEQLSDLALDDELKAVGLTATDAATRAEKEQLFLCAKGAVPPPATPKALDASPIAAPGTVAVHVKQQQEEDEQRPSSAFPRCLRRCCCRRKPLVDDAAKSDGLSKNTPSSSRGEALFERRRRWLEEKWSNWRKTPSSSRGEALLERRRRWLEKWSNWDDKRLVKRLQQLGVDASGGLPRDHLMYLLLIEQTEQYHRNRCTPKRLQAVGACGSIVAILGTFVGLAFLLTNA